MHGLSHVGRGHVAQAAHAAGVGVHRNHRHARVDLPGADVDAFTGERLVHAPARQRACGAFGQLLEAQHRLSAAGERVVGQGKAPGVPVGQGRGLFQQDLPQLLGRALHRVAHEHGDAAAIDAGGPGRRAGVVRGDGDPAQVHPEGVGCGLGQHGLGAAADLRGVGVHGEGGVPLEDHPGLVPGGGQVLDAACDADAGALPLPAQGLGVPAPPGLLEAVQAGPQRFPGVSVQRGASQGVPFAGAQQVLQAELHRVVAELGADVVGVGLAGPPQLHAADAAERARGNLVGIDRVAVGPGVVHPVRPHGPERGLAGDLDAEVGVGARVQVDPGLTAQQRAVLPEPGAHLDLRGMAPGGEGGLFHGQTELHGRPRSRGREHRQVLHADVALGAEAPAHVGHLHHHLVRVESEHARELVPHREGGLRRGMDRDGLPVHQRDRAVGLHGVVEQGREGEAVFDDAGALPERALRVAPDEVGAAAVVVRVVVVEVVGALPVVVGVRVVHQHAALHGRLRLRHLGQRRVAYPGPGRGFDRRGLAVGHHQGHRLALEPHLVVGQHRAVLDRLAVGPDGAKAPEPAPVQGVVGHDGAHAFDLARVVQVEPVDARVRVGTRHEPGELHARDREVRGVHRGPRDFLVRVEAAHRPAHVFHRRALHAPFYTEPAAVSEPGAPGSPGPRIPRTPDPPDLRPGNAARGPGSRRA